MGIRLRDDEKLIKEIDFHWLSYLYSLLWLLMFGLISLLFVWVGWWKTGLVFFVFGFPPLLWRRFENYCKCYALTNQRVYIEKGVISKTKLDLPLDKINDVLVEQNVLHRIFGGGHVEIMTGNDQHRSLHNVSDPEVFKDLLSRHLPRS